MALPARNSEKFGALYSGNINRFKLQSQSLIVVLWLFIQLGPIFRFNPLSGNMIRNYFWGDQLVYLSISASGSAGLLRDVEPFTETGRSIYPSGFYAIVGWFSRLFHLPPASALNFIFVLVSVVLVILISQSLRKLFDFETAAFAVLVPLLLGTINTMTTGNWSFKLSSHAVIWPMAAGLYTANAESLNLLLVTLLVIFLVSARLHPSTDHFNTQLMWSAVFLGLLANSHTYGLILGMTITVLLLLDQAMSTSNRRFVIQSIPRIIQVGALYIAVLFLLAILDVAPMPRLLILWLVGFGLIGILTNTRHEKKQLLSFIFIAAIVAAPQILKTGAALVTHDAFLRSRQQVSATLSVPTLDLLFRNLPLSVLVLGACFVARRNGSLIHLRINLLLYFVWLSLSLNQMWGLSQEPYRFAINAQIPLAIFAAATIITGWQKAFNTQNLKFLLCFGLVLCIIPSSLEIHNFYTHRISRGVIQLDSDVNQEMLTVVSKAPAGLLLPDPCIEPAILKVISRKKLAVYSKGLAWPDNVALITQIVDARVNNVLDLVSAKQLEIAALLVDRECPAQWATLYSTHLKPILVDPTMRFQLYELLS